VRGLYASETIFEQVKKSQDAIENAYGEDAEAVIADGRYAFIHGACKESLIYTPVSRISLSEKIDMVLLNRWLGLPIFVAIIWLLFQLTFTLGGAYDGLD